MQRLFVLLGLLLITFTTNAQHARVRQFTAPFTGSVVMSEANDKYNVQVYSLEAPAPHAPSKKMLNEIKPRPAKQCPYKRHHAHNKTTAAPSPVILASFIADSLTGIPPDNDMAISKGEIAVSVVNSRMAIHDAKAGKMTSRKSLQAISVATQLNKRNVDYRYDPKIMYDPHEDKFICVMLNATNENNWIIVGFSKTSDPAAGWNFYKFYGDYNSDTTWFDYPCVSITEDEFFLTGNKIRYSSSWQTGFRETVIYQMKKQDGYDSVANLTYQIWDSISYNGIQIRNLYPVKGGSSIQGPEQYFVSNRNFDVQNDTIFLVKVPGTIASGNTNLTVQVLQSPVLYGVPPNGRQPDTSVTLATNDGRILGAFAENDEIHFVSTTVAPVSGASGIFHGKISNYKTNPSVSANIISIDTLDFGYPNITFSGNPWGLPQALISFNYTGPNTFPGMGAYLFDATQYSDMVRVKEGVSSIKVIAGKEQRWGDYMGAQLDWNNPWTGIVWIEGIYGRVNESYGSWIAKLGSPLLNVKDKKAEATTAKLYPNPAWQFIRFEFEMPTEGAASFAIYNTAGQMVDKLTDARCKKGRNMIQFDIEPLAPGNYFLKAVDGKGQSITTKTFTRQ